MGLDGLELHRVIGSPEYDPVSGGQIGKTERGFRPFPVVRNPLTVQWLLSAVHKRTRKGY